MPTETTQQAKKTKTLFCRFANTLFSPELDFRMRLFTVLAVGGSIMSFALAFFGILVRAGLANFLANIVTGLVGVFFLCYARRSGKYTFCYIIATIILFLGLFPVLFFSAGGYHSGMPSFFVFAVLFTVFMLEGKKAIFFAAVELVTYAILCIIAYRYPQTVHNLPSESSVLFDTIVGFSFTAIALGITMFFHFRIYNAQQRKIDAQNEVLAQSNKSKTEFFANASHEMRTPLTVVSVNIQSVAGILRHMDKAVQDKEAATLLADAQAEIMRLSRMVGGMLTLASLSESADKGKTLLTPLLQSTTEMLRILLQKNNNTLALNIANNLVVFGNADLLSQVVINLIQNANAHTENGVITLSARREGEGIFISVEDSGSGIAPELLPRVFDRGVTTGGTGFGLYLCRVVVESHGGRIWLRSESGKGTTVTLTLPTYQGQFGGDAG